jgi:hypothetical protein
VAATQKVDLKAQALANAVKKRGVKFSGPERLVGPEGKSVILNEDGTLSWPVLFIYPEPSVTELVEAFHEDATSVLSKKNYLWPVLFLKFISSFVTRLTTGV